MVGASFLGLFLRLEIGIAKAEHITNGLFTGGSVGAVLTGFIIHTHIVSAPFLLRLIPRGNAHRHQTRKSTRLFHCTAYDLRTGRNHNLNPCLYLPIKCKGDFVPRQALDLISKDGYKALVFVSVNKAL